jgi:hypothetical protein
LTEGPTVTKRFVLATVVVVITAATTALAITAGDLHSAGGGDRPEFDGHSSLLVSTRTELRLCLDTHGAVDAASSARALDSALASLHGDPAWKAAGYRDAPDVEHGCPTELPPQLTKGEVLGPGLTDHPGPYRVVVVVLDGPTADRHLPDGARAALLPYEAMPVSPHVQASVTQAVAVRADFLTDPAFATDYLAPALGLHRP